jgi:VIT1/CCC1 family predicted Fe2+/Mn2+ transporter
MAASHASTATATAVTVLVTLSVYWAAERYARIVAERIHEGHHPRWPAVRAQLTSGWEMITASLLPLGVLLVAKLTGASLRTAIIAGLVCTTVLLCMAGWRIGREGRLSTLEQLVSAAVAGLFGVAMIVLKAALH